MEPERTLMVARPKASQMQLVHAGYSRIYEAGKVGLFVFSDASESILVSSII